MPYVPCENCGGEGGFPEPHGEWGLCPACEGTGELPSSEHELISLDDLDRIDREKPVDAYVDN
jgi:DnaJ-class molecular chaperone